MASTQGGSSFPPPSPPSFGEVLLGVAMTGALGLAGVTVVRSILTTLDERNLIPPTGLQSLDSPCDLRLRPLFRVAERCKRVMRKGRECEKRRLLDALRGKRLGLLFMEPSTRTRCSFEAAMKALGGETVLVSGEATSLAKGESLEDTSRMLAAYCDAIVVRSPECGSAHRLATLLGEKCPVLNGGDGAGEHPTQALLDLFTIAEHFPFLMTPAGNAKGRRLRVSFVGDLKNGRTVHSLAKLLARFRVTLRFVSPPNLELPTECVENIKDSFKKYKEGKLCTPNSNDAVLEDESRLTKHSSINEVLPISDVVYMTRIQRERFTDQAEAAAAEKTTRLTKDDLMQYGGKGLRIMHPLPRVSSIDEQIDDDPRAIYFEQAENGLYVRMAILLALFKKTQWVR